MLNSKADPGDDPEYLRIWIFNGKRSAIPSPVAEVHNVSLPAESQKSIPEKSVLTNNKILICVLSIVLLIAIDLNSATRYSSGQF